MKEKIERALLLPVQAVGILFFLFLYLLTFWIDEDDSSVGGNRKEPFNSTELKESK